MSLRDRQQLTVLGTGLMGASFAAAARRTRQWTVIGFDADPQAVREAQGRGYIDRAATSLEEAVKGAALVVIAAPIQAGLDLLRRIAPSIGPNAIVTDVLSTKGSICRLAAEVLPAPERFVGAHPMAGSDKSGPAAARLDLFQGRRCFIVPGGDESATTTVSELWRSFGARVETMEADDHDRLVAAMSHLPQALATALAGMLTEAEMTAGGNGLRDMIRIAGSDPAVWVDILLDNRLAVADALNRFRRQLDLLGSALDAADAGAIRDFLAAGTERLGGAEASS